MPAQVIGHEGRYEIVAVVVALSQMQLQIDPGVRAGFLTRVPKGRLGEPEDLAGPILFLASKASDFYTGHILYADGGYTAG